MGDGISSPLALSTQALPAMGTTHIPRASPQSRAALCPHRQAICCHFLMNPSSGDELTCLSASLPSPAKLKQPQVSPLPPKPYLFLKDAANPFSLLLSSGSIKARTLLPYWQLQFHWQQNTS